MTSPSTASETFKARMREQWDLSAQGWNDNREQIRCWLRQATDTMLDRAEIGPGARVLDVAAGAGDQTLDIAQRVGPSGRVLATDISLPILEFAKENARRAGYLNVDVRRLDGERLDLPGIFDAVICRLGLMLYPNPLEGLRGMHRALKPGGRACTLVFADAASNPCIATMMTTIAGHVVPSAARPGGGRRAAEPWRAGRDRLVVRTRRIQRCADRPHRGADEVAVRQALSRLHPHVSRSCPATDRRPGQPSTKRRLGRYRAVAHALQHTRRLGRAQ
jgi:ubiquinone/menaquinone biosynthesis C-methylase UbiE